MPTKVILLLIFFLTFFLLLPTKLFANNYYVSTDGNDSNPGSLSQPLKTIQNGINLSASGDVILIKSGTYFENLVIRNKNNISLKPFGDGEVVIDGAIAALKSKNLANWHFEGITHGAYPDLDFSVYYYDYPFSNNPYGGNYYIFGNTISDADDGDKLYFTYSGKTTFNLHHVAAMQGAGGYFTPNRVYLSLPGNIDPNTRSLNVSKNAYVILITDNSSNITIDGTDSKLITIKNGGRFGILNRSFSSTPNTGNVFRNLKIFNSVNGINFYSGGIFNNHVIENNYIERKSNPDWVWNDVKQCDTTYSGYVEDPAKSGCSVARDGVTINPAYVGGSRSMEGAGIAVSGVTGTNNIFRNNEITGYHDGITFGNGPLTSSQIYGNTIKNIQDDGLAFIGNSNYNNVYQNLVINPTIGISTAFGHVGPSYFHQNLIIITHANPMTYDFINNRPLTWPGSGMKAYREYTGNITQNVKIYYNTLYTFSDPIAIGSRSPDSSAKNYELLNNILVSQSRLVSSTSQAVEDGTIIKSNLFYSARNARVSGSKNYYYWNGYSATNHYFDLADITNNHALPANWTNNLEINPAFFGNSLDDPNTSFQLTSGSPARTTNGMILASIPADWPQADVLNQRSSAGAFEFENIATPAPDLILGDANGDEKVDGIDYIIWLTHYSQNAGGPANGDFNSDTKIDGIDYVIWLNNYGL